MSNISRFKRARAYPNAIGTPSFGFELYNFPKMKQLPMSMFPVTLSGSNQTLVSIYCEPNVWNFYKQLYIKFGWVLNRPAPDPFSGMDIVTNWQVNADAIQTIQTVGNRGGTPYYGQGYGESILVRLGTVLYEVTNTLQAGNPGLITGTSDLKYVNVSDPSASHLVSDPITISLLVSGIGVMPGDSLIPTWGTAYIESPLDLRRINQ